MPHTLKMVSFTLTAALAVAGAARADSIFVTAARFGNYAADGIGNINSPGFQNYFVGYSSPSAVAERRNFFTFDTVSFETATIISAELVLYVPHFAPPFTTDPGDGYISPDPSESYRLSATTVPASVLGDPTNTAAASIAIWDTLGTGPLAGAIEVFPADKGTYLHIALTPPAVAALNAATGVIGMGGRLTSLDPGRPLVLDELVFSFTDVPGSGTFTPPTLALEVVPAPGTSIILLVASGLLARRRR